jgi:hypothetical protein
MLLLYINPNYFFKKSNVRTIVVATEVVDEDVLAENHRKIMVK